MSWSLPESTTISWFEDRLVSGDLRFLREGDFVKAFGFALSLAGEDGAFFVTDADLVSLAPSFSTEFDFVNARGLLTEDDLVTLALDGVILVFFEGELGTVLVLVTESNCTFLLLRMFCCFRALFAKRNL